MLIETNVYIRPDTSSETGFQLYTLSKDSPLDWHVGSSDIKVETVVVDVNLPDGYSQRELQILALESLKERRERLVEAQTRELAELDKKIEQLQCLPPPPKDSTAERGENVINFNHSAKEDGDG